MRRPSALAILALLLACSRGDPEARARVLGREGERAAAAAPALDPEHPAAGLALDAEQVARALGSFQWTAAVEWTVEKGGAEAQRIHATERHAVRQLASGDFEVEAQLDPGLGPGSETGKSVVYAGGMTYARALPAAFRERPTDRGRDARRFRDESFRLAASVVDLYRGALRLEPAGEASIAGRPARRYRVALAPDAARPATAPPPAAPGAQNDLDTTRRRAFLEGAVPTAADGELLLDAASGAPLRVRLAGAFRVPDQPGVAASVTLLAQVKAVGGAVGAIAAPKGALPDERKPAGPSTALEAAGLKKRGGAADGAEPADEPE